MDLNFFHITWNFLSSQFIIGSLSNLSKYKVCWEISLKVKALERCQLIPVFAIDEGVCERVVLRGGVTRRSFIPSESFTSGLLACSTTVT